MSQNCSYVHTGPIIGDLYKLSNDNKSYLNSKFFDDDQAFEKYKTQITKGLIFELFEDRPKLSLARKAVMDYKNTRGITPKLVELMIHYLDCGSYMVSKFGYYENGFYNSMNSMHKTLMNILKIDQGLSKSYQDKANIIMSQYSGSGYF